jgi:hypothetical protein
MTENEKPEADLVEAKILIPRQVLEFLNAARTFGKWEESLEEYLGKQVVIVLGEDFGNSLIDLWDFQEILKGYGLDKVPHLNIDPAVVNDC